MLLDTYQPINLIYLLHGTFQRPIFGLLQVPEYNYIIIKYIFDDGWFSDNWWWLLIKTMMIWDGQWWLKMMIVIDNGKRRLVMIYDDHDDDQDQDWGD